MSTFVDDFAASIAEDYKIFDGTETVTVTFKRNAADTFKRICGALREPIRIQESSGEWLLSSSETFWNLPVVNVGTERPVNGDRIDQSDGTRWTVQDCELATLATRYRCRCVKER